MKSSVGESGRRARGRKNFAELGDVGHHRVDPHETALGFVRDHLGETRFAAARRTIKNQTAETIRRDQPRQQRARLQ